MSNAIFTFRIARLLTKGTDKQLLCGDYVNKRGKRCSNAQLHWEQHNFLSGLFYAYQYPNGRIITSYDRDEDMPMVSYTFNYKAAQVADVVAQIESLRDEIKSFPVNDDGVVEKEYQAMLQLQVEVKADSVMAGGLDEESEEPMVRTKFRPADIVSIKIVRRGEDDFIYTGKGGSMMKMVDFMEAFYGVGDEPAPELDTVEKIRSQFISRAEKRGSKRRRNKDAESVNVNNELANQVTAETLDVTDESDDEEIIF